MIFVLGASLGVLSRGEWDSALTMRGKLLTVILPPWASVSPRGKRADAPFQAGPEVLACWRVRKLYRVWVCFRKLCTGHMGGMPSPRFLMCTILLLHVRPALLDALPRVIGRKSSVTRGYNEKMPSLNACSSSSCRTKRGEKPTTAICLFWLSFPHLGIC